LLPSPQHDPCLARDCLDEDPRALRAPSEHGTVDAALRRCSVDSSYSPIAREVGVLRISRAAESASLTTLRVEGRIVAEWVPILERECWLALQENGHVQLDLSAVTFVDGRGVMVLRHLRANALEIINCREFIRELLWTP
jgi:ABC-type transporter Mla MlaB component